MSSDVELPPAEVGDEVEAFSLIALGRTKVVAVHHDGTVSLEHERPGRYIDDEDGSYIELGGGEPGEFVTLPYRARPERLADGTRRFMVIDPAEYQS